MNEIIVAAILTIITAATPLLYAAIGEMITEKSGVLNLGVEGMMLLGALCGFATIHLTDNAILAVLAGIGAGMSLSLIFALLTLNFQASQVASGLALTIFGVGLSALLGQELVGIAYDGLPKLSISGLTDLPIIGPLLFSHPAVLDIH